MKRIISLLLCIVMCLSLFPTAAFADEVPEENLEPLEIAEPIDEGIFADSELVDIMQMPAEEVYVDPAEVPAEAEESVEVEAPVEDNEAIELEESAEDEENTEETENDEPAEKAEAVELEEPAETVEAVESVDVSDQVISKGGFYVPPIRTEICLLLLQRLTVKL